MIITDDISGDATAGLLKPTLVKNSPLHEDALFRCGEVLSHLTLRALGQDLHRVRVVTSWLDADYIAKGFIQGLDEAGVANTFTCFATGYAPDNLRDDTDLSWVTHQFHEDKDHVDLTVIVLSSLVEPDTISSMIKRIQGTDLDAPVAIATTSATGYQIADLFPYFRKRSLREPMFILGASPKAPLAQFASALGWPPSAIEERPDVVPLVIQERMKAKKGKKAEQNASLPTP
jgi:hypothetical protein